LGREKIPMISCWSCNQETGDKTFCPACAKIQPGRPRDFFAVLGLSSRYHVDMPALEKSYRDHSRLVHPDKFAKASPKERRFSLEQSTLLNQAFKTLKDPTSRAEYVLKANGFAAVSEEAGKHGAGERLPLEFYEEVMEDREALMDAKMEGPEAVQKLADKVLARRAKTLETVDRAMTAWETSGAREALQPAVSELAKLKYYQRFLDEVEGKPHD